MNRPAILFAAIAATAALGGCTSAFEPTAKVQKVGGAWVISDTASLSHTLIREEDSKFVTCAEPPPDAAFDQGDSADVSIALVKFGGDDSGGDSQNSSEVEMAGRTPAVLIARELFYRACEFSYNFKLDKSEATAIYNKTLDIIKEGWLKEAGQTTVTIGDKLTTSTNENITNTSSTVTPTASSVSSSSSITSDSTDSSTDTTDTTDTN
jgi:hypothetical protein